MYLRGLLLLLLFLCGITLLTGCGPAAATVSGDVTVDGKPLAKGTIVYSPFDGAGTSVQADIQDGKYELHTIVGKKRVQITENLGVEKKKEHNGPGAPWMEFPKGEGLPPRYNSKSELTHELTPGSNSKDWKVERKAASMP